MLWRSFPPLQALQNLRRENVNSRYGDSWNKYSDSNAQECEAKSWARVEVCTEKAKADVKIQDEKPKGDSVLLRFGFLQEVWIRNNLFNYKQNDKDFQSPSFQNIQKTRGSSGRGVHL